MPAYYNQSGLRFAYPDNWRLESGDIRGASQSVTVSAPGTAYWTVNVYPGDSSASNLVNAVVDAIKEEYREVDVEDICETYAEREMAGCDLGFHYLDLTNTASVRWFRESDRLYLVIWQAEDREYDALAPVFEAMTVSLLRGLTNPLS